MFARFSRSCRSKKKQGKKKEEEQQPLVEGPDKPNDDVSWEEQQPLTEGPDKPNDKVSSEGQQPLTEGPDKPKDKVYKLSLTTPEDSLPPYEWAHLSILPTPAVVGKTWSSLAVAVRERAGLVEVQTLITSRIAKIDREYKAFLDVHMVWDQAKIDRLNECRRGSGVRRDGM